MEWLRLTGYRQLDITNATIAKFAFPTKWDADPISKYLSINCDKITADREMHDHHWQLVWTYERPTMVQSLIPYGHLFSQTGCLPFFPP